MPIKAHLEVRSGSAEARAAPRRTLYLATEGAMPGQDAAEVLIRNISATGLLLDYQGALANGESIAIELPEAGLTTAEIVWASEGLYGCRFVTPLSPAALSAAQLRSLSAQDDIRDTGAGDNAQTSAPPTHETLGARILRLRKEAGLTMAQLAERLGVSKPTIWAWEQGRARPVDARMSAIAEALGVSVQSLLFAPADSGAEAVIARCRAEIASACGTNPDRVRIMLEL